MFRHILVPLDGSQRAEQALPIAIRLASASGGTIILLNVVDMTYGSLPSIMGVPSPTQDVIDKNLARAQQYLDQLISLHNLALVPVEKRVMVGDPAAIILDSAAGQEIDLIVMSSHGYTGLKRWLLGSVAEKVARHSPVPVFILREHKPFLFPHLPEGTPVIRALVPLDASPRSQDAIPPAAALVSALASPGRGALHLVQVVIQSEGASETEKIALLQAARQNLAAIEQCIREGLVANFGPELHLDLSWSVSVNTDIAEGIVRVAEEGETVEGKGRTEPCDLIAMTTHGRTGLQKWAMGSITERVFRATTLPLLIVRPADIIEREHQQSEHVPPVGTTPPQILAQAAAEGRRSAAWRLIHHIMENDPHAIRAVSSLDNDQLLNNLLEFMALGTWAGKPFHLPARFRSAHARTHLSACFLPETTGIDPNRVKRVVVSALQDQRPAMRETAASILGVVGDPTTAPDLINVLHDPVRTVRLQAAKALGYTNNPVAVSALLAALQSDDELLAIQVFSSLVHLGESAIPGLINESRSKSAWIRWHCIRALGVMHHRQALPALVQALRDPDHAVAWMAAKGLTRFGQECIVPVLQLLMTSEVTPWLVETTSYVLTRQYYTYPQLKPYLEPVVQSMHGVAYRVATLNAAQNALAQLFANHVLDQ